MLTKRRLLTAALNNPATAESPSYPVMNPKWSPDIKMLPRDIAHPTMSKRCQIPGSKLSHMTFRMELSGRSAAFTANILPSVHPFLIACGFEMLLNNAGLVNATVSYRFTSLPTDYVSMCLFTDGLVKVCDAAHGNVKFSGEAGQPIYADFDFVGLFEDVFNMVTWPTSPITLPAPPVLLSAGLTVRAFSPTVKSFSLDAGNKLAPVDDMNWPTGYNGVVITDRNPTGHFDPQMELPTDHNWYGDWSAGTCASLNIGAIGTAPYNKIRITAPALLPTKTSEGDREGLEVADTDFQLAMANGDDELVITFS